MITIPTESIIPDEFRVCYRDGWNAGADWTAINPQANNPRMASAFGPGIRVVRYTRCALPEIGECELEAPLGIIDGRECMVSIGGAPGVDWVPGVSYVDAPDLIKKIIRIQARPGVPPSLSANGSPSTQENNTNRPWRTVWLGVCLWQQDTIPPGAQRIIGSRRWHCVDLLYAYLRDYHLDKHAFDVGSGGIVHSPCEGHPGFNENDGDNPIKGNRSIAQTWEPTSVEDDPPLVWAFAIPGGAAAQAWDDYDVADHCCLIARKDGDPIFTVTGDLAPLYTANVWPVTPTTTAWDVVSGIFRRQRGRGLGVMEWTEADPVGGSNDPTAITAVTIRVYPQQKNDITVTTDSTTTTFVGAASTADGRTVTTAALDLIGDNRVVDDAFEIDQRDEARVDYLESVSERIEVAVTLSHFDATLDRGWTTTEETAYNAADPTERVGPKWDHVYQVHALSTAQYQICTSADGNGGGRESFIYEMDPSTGGIVNDDATTGSLAAMEILPDLPFLVGKDYSTDPPSDYGDAPRNPARRPPLVLIRTALDRYEDESKNVRMDILPQGFRLEWSGSMEKPEAGLPESYRPVSDISAADNNAFADYEQVVTTVAIRLHNRLRAADGVATKPRKKRIYIPGFHLWLTKAGTIHDLDTENADGSGIPARRTSNIFYLRDDRDAFRQMHALAWAWYGSVHRACRWALRAHGANLLSGGTLGFINVSSGSQVGTAYPTLGKVITTLSAGGLSDGQAVEVNTPVTRIEYDNNQGVTTWHTDWSELDLGAFNARNG